MTRNTRRGEHVNDVGGVVGADMIRKHSRMVIALFVLIICGLSASGCFARADAEYGAIDQPGQQPDQGGDDGVRYENLEFGFRFSLHESWAGYSVEFGEWEGVSLAEGTVNGTEGGGTEGDNESHSEGEAESGLDSPAEIRGPIITIRHPKWTEENQRQDIPITAFTLAQWDDLTAGKFNVGAAPVGPTELGRNASFVFALPVRFSYALLEGYGEVERIREGNPLEALNK